MNAEGFCPFLFAAEELRLALQENSIPTPDQTRCRGKLCAVWNENRERCGLVGFPLMSSDDIKRMAADVSPFKK